MLLWQKNSEGVNAGPPIVASSHAASHAASRVASHGASSHVGASFRVAACLAASCHVAACLAEGGACHVACLVEVATHGELRSLGAGPGPRRCAASAASCLGWVRRLLGSAPRVLEVHPSR